MFENNRLIPNHQFGFRQRHSTIEQTHRIVQRINEALETNQHCSAAFLDISHEIGQSTASWTPIQVKTVSPKLLPNPKILPA
jgi:hypothetical protein